MQKGCPKGTEILPCQREELLGQLSQADVAIQLQVCQRCEPGYLRAQPMQPGGGCAGHLIGGSPPGVDHLKVIQTIQLTDRLQQSSKGNWIEVVHQVSRI